MSPLFLGLDLSTQQLKAIVLENESTVIKEIAVNFDRDLPIYGTKGGSISGSGGQVTVPVALWLDAIDLLVERIKGSGVEVGAIAAISGAAQQHGSVYWSSEADTSLASLDPSRLLREQLVPRAFSLLDSPIWQDSSTTEDCRNLEEIVGGAQALADISGSRAYERFTGPQIAKIRRTKPEVYNSTSRISLVSSFIPSLFIGSVAPIEVSDASGMNLLNVLTCKWEDRLLDACGGSGLRAKLGPEPVYGGTVLGRVSAWWVKRWGFSPGCIVTPFMGDNPATMVSLGGPGDAILSLGTSTTLLLSIPASREPPKRFTTSHLLSHPVTPHAKIAMLCYKNGALARGCVRDQYANGDWSRFDELVQATPPGNDGYLGFYFPLPEIIPPNVRGEFFFKQGDLGEYERVDSMPAEANPRAILESQLLSIRSRVAAILPPDAPHLRRLILTGGSSENHSVQRLAADVLGMKVYVAEGPGSKEAAGMGGAIVAGYAYRKQTQENEADEDERLRCVAEPREELEAFYSGMVDAYRVCEDGLVE